MLPECTNRCLMAFCSHLTDQFPMNFSALMPWQPNSEGQLKSYMMLVAGSGQPRVQLENARPLETRVSGGARLIEDHEVAAQAAAR